VKEELMYSIRTVRVEIGIAAGLWLIAAPWLLGYSDPFGKAALITTAFGLGVLFSAIHDLFISNHVEEWIMVVLGLLLIVSPLLFGYVDVTVAFFNAFISGLFVVGAVIWAQERMKAPPRETHAGVH